MSTEFELMVYYVEYRTPHFGLLEPDKDILQVLCLSKADAMRNVFLARHIGEQMARLKQTFHKPEKVVDIDGLRVRKLRIVHEDEYREAYDRVVKPLRDEYDSIPGEFMEFIAPMGKYADLPLILESIPDDFRTQEEFGGQGKYW